MTASQTRSFVPVAALFLTGWAPGLLLRPVLSPAADPDRLVLLDGSVKPAQVVAIRGDRATGGRVELGGQTPEAADLFALRRIERPVQDVQPSHSVEVLLSGGGRLFARQATLRDSRLRILWASLADAPPLELPVELVRAVRYVGTDPAKITKLTGYDNFARSCDSDEGREDRLFVIAEDSLQSVRGFLETITENQVAFRFEDRTRTVDLAKVCGVVLARPAGKPDHVGQCLVRLADGSSLWGRVARLDSGKLVLTVADGCDALLPWDAVARMDVRSDRLVFCSDLDPVRVLQQATLTGEWPWRRDRSVLGNPLSLNGAVYERGLGVHADCTLDFSAGGRFELFAAMIGIDAETKGKGDCLFRVLGDGKELFQQRLRGADKPVEVRVNIRGVKTVTLVVLQGEDWDLADHADWCDARFLRL
jgi:hypothetical protein